MRFTFNFCNLGARNIYIAINFNLRIVGDCINEILFIFFHIFRWKIWRGISSPRKQGTISSSGATRTSNITMSTIKSNPNEVALISDVRD